MNYTIIPTQKFEKDVKFYLNKKKYKSITDDIGKILLDIATGNLIGDVIPCLNINSKDKFVVKVRVANSDTKSRNI